jgi:regulator of RNase E activity RraA
MVVPGDIVVGDADGVVIIPRALAAEIARRGSEKEEIEAWIRSQTDAGTPARGLYPPDAKVIEEFHRWRQANKR